MIGDIVGKPGLRITCAAIPWLRHVLRTEIIIANAENSSDGSGIRTKDYRRLTDAGIDAITLGDHLYRKREIIDVLETAPNIIRPANLPDTAPGKSTCVVSSPNGHTVAITCALGRVFMKPVDCPFHALSRSLATIPTETRIRCVDFHAEATSDMQLMGRYLDGQVSAVLGTHTHVATADEQILPGGTGFQCDVGMTGPFESILGRKIDAVMEATLHAIPTTFQVATGNVRLNGTWFDADLESGKCVAIGRLNLSEIMLDHYNSSRASVRQLL